MEDLAYKAKPVDGYENIAVIQLKKQAFGGQDGLEFTEALHSLDGVGVHCVIIDLSELEAINSSGLGMLVNGLSSAKKLQIDFRLAAVPDKAMKLFKMTHLDKVFSVYDSIESAATSFNN